VISAVMNAGLFGLEFAYWTSTTIKVLAALVVVPSGALLFGYVFLFKVMSGMQSRIGPNEAGPFGTLQLLADGAKFLQKEDIFPDGADRKVFAFAPIVVLMSTFLLFIVIPPASNLQVADFDTGIFLALAVSSLSTIGVLMAGWASANKYSLIGALRAAGQLIAYELPLVLAVVGVVIQAGTMSMPGIIEAQKNFEVFGVGVGGVPFVLPQIIGFVIFLIAAQAELNQAPFDMPVAESELVAGFMTEYSGFRFLTFFLAETASMVAYAAIAATLFLGGWYLPGVDQLSGIMAGVVGVTVLLTKTMAIGFLMFWVRFSNPRLREDQLQRFAWIGLIPLSLLNIVLTGVFKVVV
jgi:NADH-quinone oxidoreductase subunit H